MKIFSVIFAIYILGLTMMPCTDGLESEKGVEMVQTISDYDSEGHEHSDTCSPFCHCSCCHTVVINQSTGLTDCLISKSPATYPIYKSHLGLSNPFLVFQPPQV